MQAMQCMSNDDTSGHTVECDDVAELAAELAATRSKDLAPHLSIAEAIAPLAERVASLGMELHVLLLGCNTIRLMPALKQKVTPTAQACVVVYFCAPPKSGPLTARHFCGASMEI